MRFEIDKTLTEQYQLPYALSPPYLPSFYQGPCQYLKL